MADGTVLIDSKLDTSGVKTGAKDIEQVLHETAKTASAAAKNIESAFKDVNYKDAFNAMPAELQKAYVKIEAIRANDSISQKQKAKEIADVYQDLGYTQEQASAIAWQAMTADTTTGSKIIIQGLSNIQEAAEQSGSGVAGSFSEIDQKANALEKQTKAVAAALRAAGNEQGALSATSKGLSQQLEAQKKKLSMLQTAMQLVTDEYGENSTEAIEVNTRMAETKEAIAKLEAELSDTDDKLRKLADGLEDTGDELAEIPDDADSANKSLKDLFKVKVGGDLLVSSLKKIAEWCVEIGKQAIEAAADVQASNAQFEQTFSGIEKTARKTLNAIAEESGITASRMQASFTKIYAFTKSVGGDTETAMDISSRAMQAAADSAAYYDRTLEETTESLMSFLKGNYENDAALGIAATETTRNAKANEMYAKSFKDLSESQKVDVLLAMVEAGNEASGALGQAAREADQWTNVTGEFNEAWKQLLASLGSPILTAITPIVQGLTDAMKGLVEQAASKELSNNMKDFDSALESANNTLAKSEQEINRNFIKAELYRNELAKLAPQVAESESAQASYANAVERLNELYPELNLQIDKETGLLTENSQAQLSTIAVLKKKYLAQAQEARYAEILEAQAEATLNLREAEAELQNVRVEQQAILTELTATTGMTSAELINLASSMEAMKAEGIAVEGVNVELLEQLLDLTDEANLLSAEIESGTTKIAEQDAKLEELSAAYGDAAGAASGLTDEQMELATAADEVSSKVDELRAEYEDAFTSARESIDSQVGLFDKLEVKSTMTTSQIVKNWEEQRTEFEKYQANLQKATELGLDETLVKQLSDGSAESMAILNELVNSTDINVDEINEEFNKLEQAKDSTAGYMADIEADTSAKLQAIAEETKTTWGENANVVGSAVDDMQRYIDGLKGKTVYIEAVTRYTTSGSASSTTYSSKNSVSAHSTEAAIPAVASLNSVADSLPLLAKGAVIPPNAPFAAILGDQTHGTNVEAPLSTIQEAVAEVLGDILPAVIAGFEEVVAVQRETQSMIGDIEIGDSTIGEAANRFNRRQDLVKGGS